MSLLDTVKGTLHAKEQEDENKKLAMKLMSLNRPARRKLAAINKASRIPGSNRPYIKPQKQ